MEKSIQLDMITYHEKYDLEMLVYVNYKLR